MISFLPPSHKQGVRYGRINVRLAWYSLLALITAGLVLGMFIIGGRLVTANEDSLRKSIERDQSRVEQLKPLHEEAKDLAATVNLISGLLDEEIKFSSLLKQIGSIMPSGAALTGLSLSQDQKAPLKLDALVTSETAAGILRENLAASSLFASADINSLSATTVRSGDTTYRFSVNVSAYFAGETPTGANQ